MTTKAVSLANTIITVPTSKDTYEAVIIILDDGTHQILNWADELSLIGLDVIYSAETYAFVCRIGDDLYIIEGYRNRVMFSKGRRCIDTNVITKCELNGVETDVPTITYIPSK